ncbi:MAG: HEPN-associated N-terminal domain-containing protein, partial [Candidatus Omnitrophica bacterium]|nr:HEPN-associated N-terminal domain-containing protein [Candidatus Omnitrophota bacterium]
MELQERGFGEVPDKYVCANCFANQGIKNFIERNAIEHVCSYCGKKNEADLVSASLEDVVGLIVRSIRRLYNDPNNCLPWDNEDQCFAGITYDIEDVLMQMEFDLTLENQRKWHLLYNDLIDQIDIRIWTPRECGPLSESEASLAGWHRFVKQVKHNSRYIFTLIKYKPEPYEDQDTPLPSQMLAYIHRYIQKTGVIRNFKKGDIVYRVRVCYENEKVNDTAHDLGTPISKHANTSNRMSPAGIPMFYGAQEKETALQEALSIEHKSKTYKRIRCVKVATFILLKNIPVIDFSERHEFCLFDEEAEDRVINAKAFLNNFVREISIPIVKDGREHVEYVPSQIVTEYLKYKCLDDRGKRIKGILYPSSKGKGISCALFFRNKHCVDKVV